MRINQSNQRKPRSLSGDGVKAITEEPLNI